MLCTTGNISKNVQVKHMRYKEAIRATQAIHRDCVLSRFRYDKSSDGAIGPFRIKL